MAMDDVKRKVEQAREELDRSRFPGRGRGPGFMPPGLAKKPASFWTNKGEKEGDGEKSGEDNRSREGSSTSGQTPSPTTPVTPSPVTAPPVTTAAPIQPTFSIPTATTPSTVSAKDAMNAVLKQYGVEQAYAKGGLVNKKRKASSKKGSTDVRGKGKAQRGIRPCKMY